MNRIYKSVWNAVTRSWTAVDEWTKSNKKQSSCVKSLTTGMVLGILMVTNSYALDYYGEVERNVNNLIFGQSTTYHEDELWTTYRLNGHDKYVLDEVNSSRNFNLSDDNL